MSDSELEEACKWASGPPLPTQAPPPTPASASDDQPTNRLSLSTTPPRHQQGAPEFSRGILTSKLQDEPSKGRCLSATARPSVAWCPGLLEGDRGPDSDGPSSLVGSKDAAGLDKAERQQMGKMVRQRGGLAEGEGEELPDDTPGVPSPATDVTTAMRKRLAVLEENTSLHSIEGQLEQSSYFSKLADDNLSDSHEQNGQEPSVHLPKHDRDFPQKQGKASSPAGSSSPFLSLANLRSAIGTPGGPTRSADTKGTARGRMHNDDGSGGEDGGDADERHSRPKKVVVEELFPGLVGELDELIARWQDETLKRMDPNSQKMKAMVRAMREMYAHDQLVPEDQRKAVHLKEDQSLLSSLPNPGFPDPFVMDGVLFRHALQACVVHGAAGSLEALLRETLVKPTEKDKGRLAVGEVWAKRGGKVLKWDDLTLDALYPSCMYSDEPLTLATEDYVPSPLVVQAAVANAPIQIMRTLLAYNADVNARGYGGQRKARQHCGTIRISSVSSFVRQEPTPQSRQSRRLSTDTAPPSTFLLTCLLQLGCIGPPSLEGAQPSEAQQRQALATIEVLDAEGLVKYGGKDSGIFDINGRDEYDNTPLHMATGNGWCSLVEWLLENGADPGAVNQFNETPLDSARRFGRKECEAVLLKHFAARSGQTATNTAAGASTGSSSIPTAAAAGLMEEGGSVEAPAAAAAHHRKRQELREKAARGVVQMKATARAIREACRHDLLTPEGPRRPVDLKEDRSLLSSLPTPMVSYRNGFVLKQALQSCALYGSAGSLDTLLRENFIKPTEEGGDEGLSVGQVRARDGEVIRWRDLSPASIEPFEGESIRRDDYLRTPLLIEAVASDAPCPPRIVKSLVEYNADVNEIGPAAVDCEDRKVMKSSAVGAAAYYHQHEVLDYLLQQPHADPSVLSEGDFLDGMNLLQLACRRNQDSDAPVPPPEPMVGSKSRKKAASKGKGAGNVGLAEDGGQQAAGGTATKEAEQKEKARQSRAVATLEVLERHGRTRSTPTEGKGGRRKRPVLSLHCRTNEGWSLLHLAAGNGWSEVIKWLLERGVDAEAVNKNETPLDVARQLGRTSCVDVLMAHLVARQKAAAADLLREEEMARKKEERAARKREQKRLKRLAAEQAESAADGEREEADDTQHETEEVDDLTEKAAAPSCPPDTHSDSVEPAFSDAPSDHQQQRNVLSQEPPAGVGPSPFAPAPLSPAHGAPASHLFAAQRPSSSSSSFVDPLASSTVSTTPADRPSSAQTSTAADQFCPANVTAQLRADLNEAIDKKESLEDQYSDLLAARRGDAHRVKELKTNIRRLKYVTPNLSHDVLVSLATAAEVHEFEAKISREEERLDELMETAVDAQHALRLQSGASKPTKAPAAEQQSASAAAAAAASASTPTSAAEGCGVPVCGAMRVLLDESSTEGQLLEAIQHIQYDIDQLEGEISRMTDEHSEIEASLQPLEQEHHTLQHEAKKRLTPTRLESLNSIAAVDAFKRDIKRAKQELRDLAREAAVRHTALEKEEMAAAAAAAADGDGGEGTCVMCISETPTVVFLSCRQKCLCEGCWRDMAAAHEAANKEKPAWRHWSGECPTTLPGMLSSSVRCATRRPTTPAPSTASQQPQRI
ncbi:unnamed protein product [Vitrella brassicaformis CCMP3155]|uniref:RING-type domain-containing protein n=1 Tax=Vitrella brassicaformis (strain CCMP3155) TaxID=1169540 RepID=A0A0G4E896_VITBC|nr:unnamed protein product [Vitrella brassicaformis CCMP3155]|eukprot:CEL91871.1 unnamed protein product [Vitrella brassicaformis CCMP3155]